MSLKNKDFYFEDSSRPEVALITNHGYASPDIEIGGAPDTGGQVVYVNTFAKKLEELGYKVTIYSRGGFPDHEDSQIREGVAYLSKYVRYEYLLGGGDEFLPKEDISTALDEETFHLYNIAKEKAKRKNCKEWEVFEFVNSHYWDAGIIGMDLIELWKNDFAYEKVIDYFGDYLPEKDKIALYDNRHWKCISKMPIFYVVKILFSNFKNISIEEKALETLGIWEKIFGEKLDINEQTIANIADNLDNTIDSLYTELQFASLFSKKIYNSCGKFKNEIEDNFVKIDKHIWNPHSLGDLKNFNLKKALPEDRSALRLCERMSHEINICLNTPFFASTSTEITNSLLSYYNVSEEKIFYFHPQVDGNIFRKYSPEELLPAYEYLSDNTKVNIDVLRKSTIIFETSRMDKTKRKDLILEAFSKIYANYENVYLFIGGGPKNKLYEGLKKRLEDDKDLQKRAFLLGYIPEKFIGHLFYIADVYISPSEMEGFGMSVSQAAATKSQIIASDLIPFAKNFVAEYVEIFPNGDVDALAEAMRKVLDKPNLENIKKLNELSQTLNWEAKTKEFIDFLKENNIKIKDGVEK